MKARSSISIPNSPFLRAITGIVAFVLIIGKLSSPYFHTHHHTASSAVEVSAFFHCDACDYEATQQVEPNVAVVLPEHHFTSETEIFETESVFIDAVFTSSESRGPPSFS